MTHIVCNFTHHSSLLKAVEAFKCISETYIFFLRMTLFVLNIEIGSKFLEVLHLVVSTASELHIHRHISIRFEINETMNL